MTEMHTGELKLRRFWTGESRGAEAAAIEAHAGVCPQCRARLKELDEQQRRFEGEISFDRFAAGVERAARRPAPGVQHRFGRVRWLAPTLAMAAAVVLTVTFTGKDDQANDSINRIKGGAVGGGGVVVRVADPAGGSQRNAATDAPERLSSGERIRIGYQPGAHRFLTAITVDDTGAVTGLYPEAGRSVAVPRGGAETRYLPDSVEFTGKGAERLVVVLSAQPLELEAVKRAARAAYQKANGDILRLPPLEVGGEQFHRTFLKP